MLVKVKNVNKEWDGVKLFEQVTFEVKEGERLALFGRNGVGKTTLLQGLTGRLPFDGGDIQRLLPIEEWGWLDQQAQMDSSLTLLEFVQAGTAELFCLKRELADLTLRMQEQETGEKMLNRYSELFERYAQLDGYSWEIKAERCLRKLNFDSKVWNVPFSQLSGGQKTKAQLASLMVREPKLVVLDEPTNHLDSAALDWLEQWVKAYPGTVVYVSHDRTFIDRTATTILELERNGCRRYPGGYTEYRAQKELELRTQEALYKKQEQEREKLLESIRMYSEWFQQAHKAAGQHDFLRSKSKKNVSRMHAKESAIERLDRDKVQKPREEAQLRMQLDTDGFAAATLLRMEDVGFAYEDQVTLFSHLSFSVDRGDRIAVLGPNGAGKSTLLKLATGSLAPITGKVSIHPQTRIGYFEQELGKLENEETILDSLLMLPGMTQSHARTILGCFLFPKEEVFKRIGDLSMGEKCRVAFLKLFFGKANLLVLDEPTNYLDVSTREKVEEALQHYPGAVLLVTHDRYLVRKGANRLLIMDGKSEPSLFPGTYDEYCSKDRSRALTTEEQLGQNERERLQLRLAQLMGSAQPEDPAEQQQLMQEIRRLRKQISDFADESQ
ncbi:ribosomal protection-like ABC-F family protein [Paenibacillus prosopidis]|uniref:ATPase subunit of ABC transporter with duplicated ATPase domains n=1 Tax=Paenibacillus prosopidis TaxID=630520 RepID=A0A368W913_9BACL|nr:ABC-F type ribosomal protection protein [Paenibacillus prosopidis]RCW49139.1 ATPase subunit of ABC transporter with duplicated ATPase domains [Paenibacillus prosopidis]